MEEIQRVALAFMKVRPVARKTEVLATEKDRAKYKPKGNDWYDAKTNNPGQIGEPIRIHETITQIVPPKDLSD